MKFGCLEASTGELCESENSAASSKHAGWVCLTPYLTLKNHVSKHTELYNIITQSSLSFRPTLAPLAIRRLNIEIKKYIWLQLGLEPTTLQQAACLWFVCCLFLVVGLSQTAKTGQYGRPAYVRLRHQKHAQKARDEFCCYQFHLRPSFGNSHQLLICYQHQLFPCQIMPCMYPTYHVAQRETTL